MAISEEEKKLHEEQEALAQEQPEQEVEENQQQESTETQEATEVKQETPAKPRNTTELNLRQLREKAEKAEREKEELARRMQEYERAMQVQKPGEQQEEDYKINPDDLVEGKHLSKYDKKIAELEKRIAGYQQQSTQMTAEAQLKAQYPDFEKVVNEQTINDLKFADPDLASSIGSNPDMLSKARAAYSAIKRLGIYQEDTSSSERQRAATNSAKPRPLASVSPQQGDSPLSHANAFANGLTDELKKQLLKEMTDARRKL